jgi:hypothetical protein
VTGDRFDFRGKIQLDIVNVNLNLMAAKEAGREQWEGKLLQMK